jgi:hypothetical protein
LDLECALMSLPGTEQFRAWKQTTVRSTKQLTQSVQRRTLFISTRRIVLDFVHVTKVELGSVPAASEHVFRAKIAPFRVICAVRVSSFYSSRIKLSR